MYHCQTVTSHTHTHTHTRACARFFNTHIHPSLLSCSLPHLLINWDVISQCFSSFQHTEDQNQLHMTEQTHTLFLSFKFCQYSPFHFDLLFFFHREKTADQASAVSRQRPAALEVKNTVLTVVFPDRCTVYVSLPFNFFTQGLKVLSSVSLFVFYITLGVYNTDFLIRFCTF